MICGEGICNSKSGDVYSFGIILHEILERGGVWALNTSTNNEEADDYIEPKVNNW